MRLLVCGGRDFDNPDTLFCILDAIHRKRPITLLIEGGQISKRGDHLYGADWFAGSWAISRRVPHWTCWPNWHTEMGEIDRAAGPRRNARMLAVGRPDGVLAMPGGKGTRNMMGRAKAAGVKVWDPVHTDLCDRAILEQHDHTGLWFRAIGGQGGVGSRLEAGQFIAMAGAARAGAVSGNDLDLVVGGVDHVIADFVHVYLLWMGCPNISPAPVRAARRGCGRA